MSNELKATGTLIGGNNFAAFEIDNLFYRASEIKIRQKVYFPRLDSNQSYKVDLADELNYPLLVTGLSFDFRGDDGQQGGDAIASNPPTVNLFVRTINRKTQKTIDETFYQFSAPYFEMKNELILSSENLYQFKADMDINGFVFIGEPVYFLPSVIVKNEFDRTAIDGGIGGGIGIG